MKLSLNSTASTLEPGGRRDRVAYPAALSASVAMTPAWTNPSCWLSSGRLIAEISTRPFSRREIRAWSRLMNPYFRKLTLTCCNRFILCSPSQLLPISDDPRVQGKNLFDVRLRRALGFEEIMPQKFLA